MNVHPAIETAAKVLHGKSLGFDEAIALTSLSGPDILDLVSLANKVRDAFSPAITACSIINAKSGACSQNCKFCAQAEAHETGVEIFPLLDADTIVESARLVYNQGVRIYGIVTSGRGHLEPTDEFNRILTAMDALHAAFPDLKVCASLGILSETCARLLAEHGAYRYNINLQTAPDRYGELITREHEIDEKIATIRYLKKHGVTVCCGGILGLGESWEDRVKMAFTCHDLDVDEIPLNVLLPIKGTPLQDRPILEPSEVATAFSIFRLVNPGKILKFAAGRETTMKDFQGLLMLAGMNSMITGGYLTTRGRSIDDDKRFLSQLFTFTSNPSRY